MTTPATATSVATSAATSPAAAASPLRPSPDALTQLHDYADAFGLWLRLHSGDVALAVAAGILIYLALRTIRRLVRRRAFRAELPDSVMATTLRVLARTRHIFLIAVAARLVVGQANAPALLHQSVGLFFILATAFQCAIWAHEVVMSLVRQRISRSDGGTLSNAVALINVLVATTLFAIASIVVLDNLGVNVTGLVAGLGIGGIAIGLAARGVFEDLFAAIAIIFDAPFRTGDTITFDQTTATVERIGLKSTRLRALTGEEVVMANTALLARQVNNFASVPYRRFRFQFGLAYESAPAQLAAFPALARDVVNGAGADYVRCAIIALSPSGVDHELLFNVTAPDIAAAAAVRHDVAVALIARCRAEGIRFAYPVQIGIHAEASDWPAAMPHAAP